MTRIGPPQLTSTSPDMIAVAAVPGSGALTKRTVHALGGVGVMRERHVKRRVKQAA